MATVASPSLGSALRELLRDGLAPGDASHAVDGLVPRFVATPSSADELCAVLAAADEHSAAVVPWGGGRHMVLGNIPSRYDLALRTAKLDRVLEHEPADMTMAVEAGITMGALQATLAGHGQFLPIDAPAEATVGGVLAAGVSGPSRHAYGLPRDWLIGCRLALADGTLVKCGGRVVKNVAGYDMTKLAVGSLGTLGVIVEATFKLAPLPAVQETLVVQCDSIDEAARLVFAADERSLALRAVALRAAGAGVQAAFWLAGPAAAVERTRRELAELSRGAKAQPASEGWWSQRPSAAGASLSASLLPSHVAALANALGSHAVLAYPTTGLVFAALPGDGDAIERARCAAVETGDSLIVTAAPPALKQLIDVWGDAGSALPLMRNLKQQFDPRATLNPGRFIGGL